MQPQLGQVSFSSEIEVYVDNVFELVIIIIKNLTLIINNIDYKINYGNDSQHFLKKIIIIF